MIRTTITRLAQAPARGRSRLGSADQLTLEHVRTLRSALLRSGSSVDIDRFSCVGLGAVLCAVGTVLVTDGDLESVS
jgi:hypothetical protein